MIKPWEKVASEGLGYFDVYGIRRDCLRSPRTGETYNFHVIETRPWVNVIPLMPDGKIVCIRQYRVGVEEVTLEIPGGIIDPNDESPAHAARREMLEETGYDAEEIIPLGRVAPNPAIQNNYCYSFLARNAYPTELKNRLDDAEDIEIELVEEFRIPHLIASEQITHGLVVAAFYFFERYRALSSPSH